VPFNWGGKSSPRNQEIAMRHERTTGRFASPKGPVLLRADGAGGDGARHLRAQLPAGADILDQHARQICRSASLFWNPRGH
jgi:hypothetical protein